MTEVSALPPPPGNVAPSTAIIPVAVPPTAPGGQAIPYGVTPAMQQAARPVTLTGDATDTGTSTNPVTLSPTGVSPGTYSSATVDSKCRLTAGSTSGHSLTGDVTGAESGTSIATTLANVGTAGTYTKVTTDSKGRVTSGTQLASSDLPVASSTLPGAVKPGTGLSVAGDGTLSVSFGTTPGTVVQGNDTRITSAEQTANKGAANGYAPLDS